MNKIIIVLFATLFLIGVVVPVEARKSSFSVKTYVPKITIPKNYKNGGSLYFQKGYLKKSGTYVQPHLKTKADNTIYNNRKYILGY